MKTWGCTHNTSDSEYMAGQLAAHGYTITGNICFKYIKKLSVCAFEKKIHGRNWAFRNHII